MLLNFIPYLGAMVTSAVLAVVASLTFESLSYALYVPGSLLLLTALEGQVITPLLLGRRLALNPVIVFLGLIFSVWLWGPARALVAVPLLVPSKSPAIMFRPSLAGVPYSAADAISPPLSP